jgi:hypothetical protein
MIRPSALLLAFLAFAVGCAQPGPVPLVLTPFSDNDFARWKQNGTGTLSGQAFVKLPNGRVVTCAGETISLVPATGYNMELEKLLEDGRGYPVNYDRHEHKYDRKTMCDGSGHFAFDHLPALTWLVVTHVTWQEPSRIPLMSANEKGGYLFAEIELTESANKLTLSNQDFVADNP